MGTHSAKQKPGTIAALAGARAIPPLLIVLYHYCEGHHYFGVRLLDLVVTRGYLWVEFFFALSGFILTHVYATRGKDLWTRHGYFGFLKARLIRLYPLHLFMLLAMLALLVGVRLAADMGGYVSIYDRPSYHPNMSVEGFFASLFLVNGWNTLSTLTWNGASWFVSVEFALCLMFPLFIKAQDGRAWRGLALVAAGVAGLMILLATSRHGLDLTFNKGVFRGMANFAIGVGLARLFRAVQGDRIPVWVHSALQLGLVAFMLFIFTNTGWSHTGRDIFTALSMQALIPALAFDKGIVADLLKFRLPQNLGEWSYGIYLGQTFWLQYMRVIEFRFYPAADTLVLGVPFSSLIFWLEPTLLLLVCTLWGALLAEKIEIPAAKWLRARLDQPRRAAPPSGIT
jgi:peptidoglycan/LPS O-acetylase OafA/YrhL